MDISDNIIYNNIQQSEEDKINGIDELNYKNDILGTMLDFSSDGEEILLGTKFDDHILKNVEDWNETFNYGLSEFERYTLDDFKESMNAYSNITINVDEDKESNYKYYSFESKTNNGFISHAFFKVFIIVFESYNSTLININSTIMPLYDFINITHMNEMDENSHDILYELRKVPTIGGQVRCFSEWTQKEFVIKNVSIPILMRAVSYFQQLEKDKDKEVDKDNLVNEVIVNEFIKYETVKKDKKEHVGLLKFLYNTLKWALW
jgi:hypothetical protein